MTDISRHPAPRLGIVRGYPRPLFEQPELRPLLHETRESFPGARELGARLMTIPTHHMLTTADLGAMRAWLRGENRYT